MTMPASTRPDTLGPYFPPAFAEGPTLDLMRAGTGDVTIALRVLDRDGRGATNLLVEAWQPDGAGRRPVLDSDADPRLASIGRLLVRDGAFTIRTLRPGGDGQRAGWIALTLYSDGLERLATQIFLADDPALGADPLLRALPPERAASLTARSMVPGRYALDLRLSGDGEAPFFAATKTTLRPYPGDNTSVERTPLTPLLAIPPGLTTSFAPHVAAAELPSAYRASVDLVGDGTLRPVAAGTVIEVEGRVRDGSGAPLPGIVIELWAANTHGRYRHPDDRTDPPLDPGYGGIARIATGDDGGYRVRMIAPGAYLARPDIGRWRPGHIHASLIGRDVRLVTQLYFPGDPHHAPDPMRIAHGDAFDRQLLRPDPAVAGRYRYDFVVARSGQP